MAISEPAAERGRGPGVLLIHGQPGIGDDWEKVVHRLEADHRVLFPDRPGYGAGSIDPVPMAENAILLAELLERAGAAPATVVGHSYGGGIAILLAAHRPDLVDGLVLVGSVGRADSVSLFDRLLALPLVGEVLSASGLYTLGHVLPRLRRQIERNAGGSLEWLVNSLPDDRYQQTAAAPGRRVWRSFVAEQRFLVDEAPDIEDALDAVEAPSVVITGTLDVVVPPSVATSLATAIRRAELVAVARTGHFVPRDRPAVVADAVRRLEARRRPG